MSLPEQLVTIIYEAIDEANEARPKQEWIRKDREEPLVGGASKLDSLSLLNLVVAVEERVNAKFGVGFDLASLLTLDPATSPLRTVATLAEHLGSRVQAER
jgi:hypothetical protein